MQQKTIDKIFLNESKNNEKINKDDEWTKFINDNIITNNYNKNDNNNDEYINELNLVNNFILNTVNSPVYKENKSNDK